MSWTKEKWQWHKSLELESLESVIEIIRSVDLFTESQSVNWNHRVCNTSKCCVSVCQLILFVTLVAPLSPYQIYSAAFYKTASVPPTHGANDLRQLVVDSPTQCMRAYETLCLEQNWGAVGWGVEWTDLFCTVCWLKWFVLTRKSFVMSQHHWHNCWSDRWRMTNVQDCQMT